MTQHKLTGNKRGAAFRLDPAREVMLRWRDTDDPRWHGLMPGMRAVVEQYEREKAAWEAEQPAA